MSHPTTYFHQRLHLEYGATEADYSTMLGTNLSEDEPYFTPMPRPYFWASEAGGIIMQPFSLYREIFHLTKQIKNEAYQPYQIERLAPDQVKDGKYKFPTGKGIGTFPFWPVSMVERFERKEPSNVLVITEGYLKAWYAGRFGFPIVGLGSISHYKDKGKNSIHTDVIDYIRTNKVKRVIILWDADATNIRAKDLQDGKDLRARPYSFYSAAKAIRELVLDYVDGIYYANVKPGLAFEDEHGIKVDAPKGLDDLLLCMKGREADVLADLTSFSTVPTYFDRLNISSESNKLAAHFHLKKPELFYDAHAHIIKDSEFIFNGTHYIYNEEEDKLQVRIPAEAKNLAMVADDFYEFIESPDQYEHLSTVMVPRKKSTIVHWYGKDIIKHIPIYKAFTNVPNHIEWQPVIHGCYNKYAPFEHEPEEGNCNTILGFIKHIFGNQLEMGLDYVQLLYQQPALPPNIFMPILCLVSKEQSTGKSTFGKLLKAIFTQNAIFIGNKDLEENFNSSYASKLLIMCEETIVDKRPTIEMLKGLSTSNTITLKDKFKSNAEIPFFGRIMLFSNHEKNFIYADKNDTRYWVVKVPVIPKGSGNVNLLPEMEAEIPAFLHYLNNRKLSQPTPVSRFWWSFDSIKTEAFYRLVDASRKFIDKDIELALKEAFFEFPECESLSMTITTLADRVKAMGKAYANRDIVDFLKEEKGISFPNKSCKNVVERKTDGVGYRVMDKVARAATFDRRDWLTDAEQKEIAETRTEPAATLTPLALLEVLKPTLASPNATNLFNTEIQVFIPQNQLWVKVDKDRPAVIAWQPERFEGMEVVEYIK